MLFIGADQRKRKSFDWEGRPDLHPLCSGNCELWVGIGEQGKSLNGERCSGATFILPKQCTEDGKERAGSNTEMGHKCIEIFLGRSWYVWQGLRSWFLWANLLPIACTTSENASLLVSAWVYLPVQGRWWNSKALWRIFSIRGLNSPWFTCKHNSRHLLGTVSAVSGSEEVPSCMAAQRQEAWSYLQRPRTAITNLDIYRVSDFALQDTTG